MRITRVLCKYTPGKKQTGRGIHEVIIHDVIKKTPALWHESTYVACLSPCPALGCSRGFSKALPGPDALCCKLQEMATEKKSGNERRGNARQ